MADKGFSDLNVTRQFLNALEENNITTPTPIQEKTIPPARAGQDIIGIAQTGTGKTLAYLIPLAMFVKYHQAVGIRAVVLAPTKELVLQIHQNLLQLITYTDIVSVCLYGGVGKKEQTAQLEQGPDVVVTTPGRLLDLYQDGVLKLRHLKLLVLDEADRMMEMGFMRQLRSILEIIPRKRQNLLFSATFPERVESLAAEFLDFPTRIEVAPQATPVAGVEQAVFRVPNFRTKLALLLHLLKSEDMQRVMVFCSTRETAGNIHRYLDRMGVGEVRVLHSNKAQNSRINALEEFRNGAIRIIVSTDVTSRGIDVSAVSHVINFNIPRHYEDYVHRIGRTARLNAQGVAYSFEDPSEKYHTKNIEALIRMEIPVLELPQSLPVLDYLKGEKQELARRIDEQKRKADPTFKGAFHEKKRKPVGKKSRPKRR